MRYDIRRTDVLVAGAGAAGLRAALEAARAGRRVAVLSKGEATASCAILGFNRSDGLLFDDTMRSGAFLSDPALVRLLSEEAGKALEDMEALGVPFDRDRGNALHLLQPLGCSLPRLAHSANETGLRCMRRMREALDGLGVEFVENALCADALIRRRQAAGAIAFDTRTGAPTIWSAGAMVLATGGVRLTPEGTYPADATGDGYGIALRAGARLRDMEFMQFEPCRCVHPRPLGISTTLLAKGGTLWNGRGERFVLAQGMREGEASKAELARLIALEILQGRGTEHGGVWLDLTGLPEEEIRLRHEIYWTRFLRAGLDLTRQRVEVGPAAHSMMGGVVVDSRCASDVPGLYACGETMGGLHGANRIGGNAGTEVLVFGAIAGREAAAFAQGAPAGDVAAAAEAYFTMPRMPAPAVEETRRLCAQALGPVREGERLRRALEALTLRGPSRKPGAQAVQAENLCLTALCACKAALLREESRGAHYRLDCPKQDKRFDASRPLGLGDIRC